MRGKRSAAMLVAATTLLTAQGLLSAAPASAATSIQIVYSADNGQTWSTSLPVPNPTKWLARIWYDNTDSTAYRNASVLAHRRSKLVTGTTKVCLAPKTSDPANPDESELACNTDPGQTGPIDEGAVWSGGQLPVVGLGTSGTDWNLQISPTAGLFAEPANLTEGILERGKKRYLHLQRCGYFNSSNGDDFMSFIATIPNTPYKSGTDASNGAKALSCGPGQNPPYPYRAGATIAHSLLGLRYFNLQQCVFNQVNELYTLEGQTGTGNVRSSPTAQCAGSVAGNSGTQAIDLLTLRYVNLQQCVYAKPGDFHTNLIENVADRATRSPATGSSNAPKPAGSACASGYPASYASVPVNSGLQVIDTEDTKRGAGFIQFEGQPQSGPSPYDHARPISAFLLIDGAITAKDSGGWNV